MTVHHDRQHDISVMSGYRHCFLSVSSVIGSLIRRVRDAADFASPDKVGFSSRSVDLVLFFSVDTDVVWMLLST